MRLSFSLLCLVLQLGTSPNGGAAQSPTQPSGAPGFSISISTPESAIKPGTDLILDVAFTDISSHVIQLGLDEGNYWPDVRDEHGEPARLTAYGKNVYGTRPQISAAKEKSFLTVPLQPGETAKAQINVSRLFDLSWVGKYTISVEAYDPENRAQMHSNEIGVTVVQVHCRPPDSTVASIPSPPVTITLSTKHHAVEVGSEIVIDESVTNISVNPVALSSLPRVRTTNILESGFEMKDPGGCPVKVRKDLQPAGGSWVIPPPIRPGERRTSPDYLSRFYDFSQPGVYTIQEILTNQKTGQRVKSNILTITVFEGCTAYGADVYSAPTYWVEKSTPTPAGTVKRGHELYDCRKHEETVCAPVLIARLDPKYTDEALKKQLSGAVVVSFLVTNVGKTSDVQVLEPLDGGLDEQAADAVKRWRFKPALYKGETFAVKAQAAVEFGCEAAKFPRKFMAAP